MGYGFDEQDWGLATGYIGLAGGHSALAAGLFALAGGHSALAIPYIALAGAVLLCSEIFGRAKALLLI